MQAAAIPWGLIWAGFATYIVGWWVNAWLTGNGFYGSFLISDIPVYQDFADAVLAGAVPYRDYAIEYPPLALPFFLIPAVLGPTDARYYEWFASLMLAFGALGAGAVGAALAAAGARRGYVMVALAIAAASPFLLQALIVQHYDLVPAMLTAIGLAFATAGRLRIGAIVLALGTLAKVYPAVAIPVLVIAAWRRGGRREAAWVAGSAVVTTLVVLVPFLIVGAEGIMAALGRYVNRPLQIEGLGGALLLALRSPLGLDVTIESSFGSQNVVGGPSGIVGLVLLVVQVASLLGVYAWSARRPATPARVLRAGAAAVLVYVVFGKVFSPQYLVWLLPLVVVIGGRRGLVVSVAVIVAAWLTDLYFPVRYFEYAAYDGAVAWVVLARDLVLVMAVLALAVPGHWFKRLLGTHAVRAPAAAVTG